MADDTKAKVAAGVGAFGTTAAIGAAAMTSTLATLGLGSMAAGIGVVAAAPVAIGGACLWSMAPLLRRLS